METAAAIHNGPPSFDACVEQLFMDLEEARRRTGILNNDNNGKTNDDEDAETVVMEQWHPRLEHLMQGVHLLKRLSEDDPGNQVKKEISQHAWNRTKDLSLSMLKKLTDPTLLDNGEVSFQTSVARITELALVLQNNETTGSAAAMQVPDLYSSYQRKVLRQRCKPSIAHLANLRRLGSLPVAGSVQEENQDEDDEVDDASQQPHGHVLTVILGEASSLLHPLLLWKESAQNQIQVLCQKTIDILDQEAQSLSKTVGEWFLEDRKVNDWNQAAAAAKASNGHSHYHYQQQQQQSQTDKPWAQLDALVEEMAYICQVVSRYGSLIKQQKTTTNNVHVLNNYLQELSLHYASLEAYLCEQSVKQALKIATPVEIVIGEGVMVPSVVEDAYYISTRATERASSTLSGRAVVTVGHAICQLWAPEGFVHGALVEQRGCQVTPESASTPKEKDSSTTSSKPSSGNFFAVALLEALDSEDGGALGGGSSGQNDNKSRKLTPPTSGGLFSGGRVDLSQIQLDTQLCTLNGIHSASSACVSLSNLFLPEDNNSETDNNNGGEQVIQKPQVSEEDAQNARMLQFSKDELVSHSQSYQRLLTEQIRQLVFQWCEERQRSCFGALVQFVSRENYNLNANDFYKAESEDRLGHDLLQPLRDCRLFQAVQAGKCDADVALHMAQEMSQSLANKILQVFLDGGSSTSNASSNGSDIIGRASSLTKPFNDWGAILLSKQVRLLENFVGSLHADSGGAGVLSQWAGLNEAVTILQLEKPSDWVSYQTGTRILEMRDVQKIMSLRVDFSDEAVSAVCRKSEDS